MLDLAYADLCRWMSGWGFWGDVRNLQCAESARGNRVVHSDIRCGVFHSALARFHGRATAREVLDKIDGGREDLESEEAYKLAVWRAFPLKQEHSSRRRDAEDSDRVDAKRCKS